MTPTPNAALLAEAERVAQWMESFSDDSMKHALSLHYDFRGRAVPLLRGLAAALRTSDALVHDICNEWTGDCCRGCDSYGHEAACEATNIAAFLNNLKVRLAHAEQENATLKAILRTTRHQLLDDLSASGKTIFDFFNVWLDRERRINDQLTRRVAAFEALAREAAVPKVGTAHDVGWICTGLCDRLAAMLVTEEPPRTPTDGGTTA